MKATIVMAALALTVSVPAHAQGVEDARPGQPDRERQFQGTGGPQFRGGDRETGERGGYGLQRQGRRGQEGWDGEGPGRGQGVCPNCGRPQRDRQESGFGRGDRGGGQEFGQGPQRGEQGFGPQARRGGRAQGSGPRWDDMDRPSGPPPGQYGQGERQEARPQGQYGYGPRRRGYGAPPWSDEDDRPAGPRGPKRGGSGW